jgi:hypothetical protein
MAAAAEVINPIYNLNNPPIVTLSENNQANQDLRCLNYIFQIKYRGKTSWNYTCPHCKTQKASLSVRSHGNQPEDGLITQQ